MRYKLVLLSFLLGSSLFAQDSTLVKPNVKNIVDRFEQITGPDVIYNDSLNLMRKEIKLLKEKYKTIQDTLTIVKIENLQLHKTVLVNKYGDPKKKIKYENTQYQDFEKNLFLQKLIDDPKTVLFFYPINVSTLDYSMYTELNKVKKDCNSAKSYKIVITSYSDKTGNEKINSELEKQRSASLKKYLVHQLSLDESKIIIEHKKNENNFHEKELDFLNRRASLVYEIQN